MNVLSPVASLMNRAILAMRAGISFGGNRNLYATFGYKNVITAQDYLLKYIRQDITQRIINSPVDATWTEGPTLNGGSTFNKAWEDLVGKFPVYPGLRKADIFAGLGAFSILVIGTDDGQRLDMPASKKGTRKLTYLQPYLEVSVAIDSFETDTSNPRFGLPTMYTVTPGNILTSRTINTVRSEARQPFKVHYSRVLHLADNTLENLTFGHSRLEAIYNTLDDLLKVAGGSAETYWMTANRGMHVDVDKEMELDDDDAAALSDELDEYQHQIRRVIRTRGVKVTSLGSDVADPRSTFDVLISLLAAQSGIPQRVMLGAEAGQLASQQDRANWSQRVAERIANFAEPTVLKPFVQTLVGLSVLPEPSANLEVSWPEPFKMNPLERAQTSAQQARSLTNVASGLQKAQQMMTKLVSIEEARQIVAPGSEVLVLDDKLTGTFPPEISQPTAEPVDPNKLTPEQQMQVASEQADALAQSNDNASGSSGDTPVANATDKPMTKKKRVRKSPAGGY